MTKAFRPLPLWLKLLMWIFGALLILSCLWDLFLAGLGFLLLAHAKDGLLTGSGLPLAGLLGQLTGGLLFLWLGIWMVRRASRKPAGVTETVEMQTEELPTQPVPAPPEVIPAVPAPVARATKSKNWQLCNVLQTDGSTRTFWQFDATQQFALKSELRTREGDALPQNLVAKSWGALLKAKLNVAWLPAENVFLRVAQFPVSTPEETRAMVELQLEKLSPIPVTQALWTMIILPKTSAPTGEADKLQTIVVIVVARGVVEDFLGRLEGQGYMADRLELPMLDQLQATHIAGDGAWVYPETSKGITKHALVAWWYGGVLQNLALVSMEEGPGKIANLKDQLVQMAWAGELEGWLTAAPQWHFVGNANDPWYGALRETLEQPIEVVPPIPEQQLAAMTARRAASSDGSNNLLPLEFSTRYHQQFVDRLWGRGLLATFGIYLVCLAIYFVALTVFTQLTGRVEAQAVAISGSYTNSLQMRQMLNVLQDRDRLKFAALDCWEAVAETMPTGLTLETMNFDGRALSLRGTAPTDQVTAVNDFFDSLRRWKKGTQALFDTSGGDVPRNQLRDASTVNWSFELDLKQTEKK